MASKDNSPAISFFSFQDIITSITGIMFLVVIMLVLMVLQQGSSVPQQKQRELQKELKTLEEEQKKINDELNRLRQQAEQQKKRIDELAKLRMEQLPELRKEWLRKLQEMDNSIEQLNDENTMLIRNQRKNEKLKKQKEQLVQSNREQSQELVAELAALDEKIKEREKIFLKFQKVVRFVWPQNTGDRPVLLECSEKEIRLSTTNDKDKIRIFRSHDECLTYCRSLAGQDLYLVLLLKPSFFPYAEKFTRELRKAGCKLGREVLPDEETVIFGEEQK